MFGKLLMQQRLAVVFMLHPFAQRIADQAHMVAGLQNQPFGSRRLRRARRANRREDNNRRNETQNSHNKPLYRNSALHRHRGLELDEFAAERSATCCCRIGSPVEERNRPHSLLMPLARSDLL